MEDMGDCIFCKIVSGESPSAKILETDKFLVFKNIMPKAPVHLLVIPKKHIENLVSCDDKEMLGEMMLVVNQVARDIGIEKAFKTTILNGAKAGQRIFHLHIHVLGGWNDNSPSHDEL